MRSLIFIVSTLAALSTFAAPTLKEHEAVLTKVRVNGVDTNYRGTVSLNPSANSIELKIYNDPCDTMLPGIGIIRCQAMPTLVRSMKVPVLATQDSCGSLIFEGHELLESGSEVVISVVDNSTRLCLDLPPALIMASAEVREARSNVTTTYWLE